MAFFPRIAQRLQDSVLDEMCAYYEGVLLPSDMQSVLYSDGSRGCESATLLCKLSPVWRLCLQHEHFQSSGEVSVGMTKESFTLLKAAWLQLLRAKEPVKLTQTPVLDAIRLLVAMDEFQVCPALVECLVESVRTRLRMEHCVEICADKSIEALPEHVLNMMIPTLLEYGPLDIASRFIDVERAAPYVDSKGIAWSNRMQSKDEMRRLFLTLDADRLNVIDQDKTPWRHIQVEDVFSYDRQCVVIHYITPETRRLDRSFLVCLNVVTGQLVGTPREIGDMYCSVYMNGLSFFVHRSGAVRVYDRGFFVETMSDAPVQVIQPDLGSFRVWALCSVSDTVLIESKDTRVIAVYAHNRRDNVYTEAYRIALESRCLLGGLCLSNTRFLLHYGVDRQSWLQIFENGQPVGGPRYSGGFSCVSSANRLCHLFGRIYFQEIRSPGHAGTVICMLDPLSLESVGIVSGSASNSPRQLLVYGTRILIASDPEYEWQDIPLHMLDLFSNEQLPGHLSLSVSMHYWPVVVGAMVVVVNRRGRIMILSRVE